MAGGLGAGGGPGLGGQRRIVLVALADFDDAIVGIADPDGGPAGDERVEVERPEVDLEVGPERLGEGLDIRDLEGEVAKAGEAVAVVLGRTGGSCPSPLKSSR